jgi:hypothetical protein
MRSINSLVTLAALLAAAPAGAGVILHAEQSVDAVNRHSHTEMDLSAEGDGLRADVTASDDPFTPVGSYMLFPNDETIYLVNPAKKTYTNMDMAAMAGMMQQVQRMQQQASGSSAPVGPEHVVVEKKLDEAGPVMLGLPTQHVLYDVSYHIPPSAPGGPAFDYHEKYEIWATRALEDRLAAAPVLKRAGSRLPNLGGVAGSGEPKEVTDAIGSHGFILKQNFTKEGKMIVQGMMAMAMGPAALFARAHQPHNASSFVVTAIRDESLQAERFVLPTGYTETEMMNPNMGAMPDLSKLPGKPEGAAQPGNAAQPMPDLNNLPK